MNPKTFFKSLLLSILIVIICSGCSSEISSSRIARVLIDGDSGYIPPTPCLIDIYDNGIVEYTHGKLKPINFSEENMFKEIIQINKIQLSRKNKTIIDELIRKAGANEPIEREEYYEPIEIIALINNKEYWSPYYPDPYSNYDYDDDLANLVFELVDLAPVNVGGLGRKLTREQ